MKVLWNKVSHLRGPLLALLLSMLPPSTSIVLAQEYPTRPITMIIPIVAGSGVDVLGRLLADKMKAKWGQPVVVENVPTAAGTVGVGQLTQAVPDGYTIGIGDQTTHVVSSLVTPVRYNVLNDLDPIALMTMSPVALIGRKTLQASDMKQLIGWLRENPDKGTAASFGQGSGPNIISATFQKQTGTHLRMVTYRGLALAFPDLISGQIDLMFVEQSNMTSHLAAGTIKAFAIMDKNRSAAVPEVPTIEEAGGPPLHIVTWRGMWVPKGTPAPVSSKLVAAVTEALSDPTVRMKIAGIGQEIVSPGQQTPQGLAAHHKAEIEKWTPMVKAANIKAE